MYAYWPLVAFYLQKVLQNILTKIEPFALLANRIKSVNMDIQCRTEYKDAQNPLTTVDLLTVCPSRGMYATRC